MLQRARLARGITLEDAERLTRIPRRYLEALEQENYGILPAPVYARGFLRSYASHLGLDPAELLPFFPVGHVEEPKLQPLPQLKQPRSWTMSGFAALAAVAVIVVAVVALYGLGRDNSETSLLSSRPAPIAPVQELQPQVLPATAGAVVADFSGFQVDDATAALQAENIDYVVIAVRAGDVPKGQVVSQNPAPGSVLETGQVVTLIVSR
jgi:hypothetical protein